VARGPRGDIHRTNDVFVRVAVAPRDPPGAHDPKKLWIVSASDHRFSDNLAEFDRRLVEAIEWVKQNSPR